MYITLILDITIVTLTLLGRSDGCNWSTLVLATFRCYKNNTESKEMLHNGLPIRK